jgi:hypothetical protein
MLISIIYLLINIIIITINEMSFVHWYRVSLTTGCQLWWFSSQVAIFDSLYHSLPVMESLSIVSHFLFCRREYIISYMFDYSSLLQWCGLMAVIVVGWKRVSHHARTDPIHT